MPVTLTHPTSMQLVYRFAEGDSSLSALRAELDAKPRITPYADGPAYKVASYAVTTDWTDSLVTVTLLRAS